MTEARIRWLLALGALGAFLLIMTLEIATENDDVSFGDIAVDALTLLLTIASAASVVLLFGRIERQGAETRQVIAELEEARREGASWRAAVDQHVDGLRAAIDGQFATWQMTDAERDVALLILKGLSHKEIALLRHTSERTVRQQAQQVYRKSGLSGKNAFAAFFLEDMLTPNGNGARNGADLESGAVRDARDFRAKTTSVT